MEASKTNCSKQQRKPHLLIMPKMEVQNDCINISASNNSSSSSSSSNNCENNPGDTNDQSSRQQTIDNSTTGSNRTSAGHDSNHQQLNQNNDLDASSYNHQCYICDKIFSANSNLNRHLRKIHQENVQSPYNNVKCALCESVFSSSSTYNQHLEKDHQVRIDIEQLTFSSKETFEEWKHSVENETTSQYIKSRGEKKSKNINKTYYSCNRSGYYVSKARTRKKLKKQGSRKINGRCPASMNVTVNPDSTYDVRFVKTHVGHNFDIKHLDLSEKDRELIVQKLESGLTKKDIIKQIRLAVEQHNTISNTTNSTSPASTISVSAQQPVNTVNINDSVEVISTDNEIIIPITSTSTTPVHSSSATVVPTIIAASPATTPISTTMPITTLSTTPTVALNNCTINHISFGQQPTSRLHLATTKDIHNIINSKHLDSKLIRHNYDLNNIEAWISEMREFNEASSVLFYKSQSELIDRFPKLREDDFMLIIMKDGQSEVLKNYGERCIIIDSTYNVHCEYLHVTSISVIDGDGKGFPVTFLFSTRTDEEVLEVAFTIMRDKVGTINSRMVIADELNDFYQAWTKVMCRPTHNLLTPWSVFDEWSKKFDLIQNRDKLRKLKKSLRALLTEAENDKFTRSLNQVVEDCKQDSEMSEFLKFFNDRYAKNPDLWSSCLRKTHGASNFNLWKLHERFKLVYKEGKNSKKLCKYVASLMSLFDDSQMDKLAKMDDQNSTKEKALFDRHKKSVEIGSLVYEVAVDPVYWLCPSESSNEVYYEVKPDANSESNCCDLKCPSCDACRHAYKCTCLDYVVNLNMCKHIHRICTMCKQPQ